VTGERLRILFLCTGNSCRSQMAEGWARHLRGDVVEAYSAGLEAHGLNPHAVRVMAEAGVDISGQRSKRVDELAGVPFDYVITVCDHAHENCPLFPGNTNVLHVGFDDPPRLAKSARTEAEALGHYRRVRDEIRAFVETLPGCLPGGAQVQQPGDPGEPVRQASPRGMGYGPKQEGGPVGGFRSMQRRS
jgi:arsenate reductase (thioredoxin)